jgi:EAL domain-containing protein (putative c-di-GMP-specific phosphodiesterase class I)
MRSGWVQDHSVPVTILRFLKGDGLRIEFQPIADLATGTVVGVEALARFSGEPYEQPERWFERAGDLGMRAELEARAIDSAIEQLSQVPSDTYLTLNCSPGVACSGILDRLLEGRPLNRIVVEITEGEKIQDYPSLNRALARLRARGLRVAIDDAGAGFAGITHLIELRPDIIKLDIELTRNIDSDPHRKALVGSLTKYARDVNATIVAEGIETKNELRALQRLGVHYGQGYYLGRPAPLPRGGFSRIRMPSRRLQRRLSPMRRTLIGVAAVLILAVPTAALANGSMPGSVLWPVKLGIESMRLALAGDHASKAKLHIEFANRRTSELAYLLSTGNGVNNAMAALDNLRTNTQAALLDARLASGRAGIAAIHAAVEHDLQSVDMGLVHACADRWPSCAHVRKSLNSLKAIVAADKKLDEAHVPGGSHGTPQKSAPKKKAPDVPAPKVKTGHTAHLKKVTPPSPSHRKAP